MRSRKSGNGVDVLHGSAKGSAAEELIRLAFPRDGAGRRALAGFLYQHLYVMRLMRRILSGELDAYVCENGGDFLASTIGTDEMRLELIEVKSRSGRVFGSNVREAKKALQLLADRAHTLTNYFPKADVICRLVFSRSDGNPAGNIHRLHQVATSITWPSRCEFEPEAFVAAEPTVEEMRVELEQLCESEPGLSAIFTEAGNRETFLETLLGLTVPFHTPRCVRSLAAWIDEEGLRLGEAGQDTSKAVETVQSAINRVLEQASLRAKNPDATIQEKAIQEKGLPILGVVWGLPERLSRGRDWWNLGDEAQAREKLRMAALVSSTDPSIAPRQAIFRNSSEFAVKLDCEGATQLQQYLTRSATTHHCRTLLILSFARAIERWASSGLVITGDFADHHDGWLVRDSPSCPEFVSPGFDGLVAFDRTRGLLDCRWIRTAPLAAAIHKLYFGWASTASREAFLHSAGWNDHVVTDFVEQLENRGFIHATDFRQEIEELFASEHGDWPIFISSIDSQFLRDVLNTGKSSPLEALCEAQPTAWQFDRGRREADILFCRCTLPRGSQEVQIGLLNKDDGTFAAYRYLRYGIERWFAHSQRDRHTTTPIIEVEAGRRPAFVFLNQAEDWREVLRHVFAIPLHKMEQWLTNALSTVRSAVPAMETIPWHIEQENKLREVRRAGVDALRRKRFSCHVVENGPKLAISTDAHDFKRHIERCGYRLESTEGVRINAEDDDANRVRGDIRPGMRQVNRLLYLPIELLPNSGRELSDVASFELIDRGSDAIVGAEQSLFNALRASFRAGTSDIAPFSRQAWNYIATMLNKTEQPSVLSSSIVKDEVQYVHEADASSEDDLPSAILDGFTSQQSWQILTGAPGTGKTCVVAALAAQYLDRYAGRDYPPCRVLVVANTHWAIENFMRVFESDPRRHHLVLRSVTPRARTRISEESDSRREFLDEQDRKFEAAVVGALPQVSAEVNSSNQVAVQRARLNLLRNRLRAMEEEATESGHGCLIPSHVAWRARHGLSSSLVAHDLGRSAAIVEETLRGIETYESSSQSCAPTRGQVGDLRAFAAQLVAATVDGFRRLPDMGFDLIIFEEASQLDITALLKVLTQVMRGRSSEKEINVILSGDPQQLPPHIEQQLPDCVINIDHDSALRKAHEYARRSPSFFATICSDHSADRRRVHTLTVQHRMHPEIALLVNTLFYRDQHWRWTRKQGDDSPAVWWVDSRPFGDEAERQHEGTSWFHRGELEIVRRLHAKHGDEQFLAVTAYRAQQELLEAVLGGSGSCCTIDGCQGIEADTVVFSFVRMALFVVDSHRLNVAFSRARKRLYLVGDFAQLCREAADFERPHIRGLAELFSDSGRFAGRVIAPDPGSWILP